MTNPEKREETVLVIGCGSIGRRHVNNLRKLGISRIGGCDTDPERLAYAVSECGVIGYQELDKALDAVSPDIVIVSTPPSLHVPQALAGIRCGAHVFVEKPLSHSLKGVAELIREASTAERTVAVGYNFRHHPGLLKAKSLLEENTIGRVLWARTELGQYLPDWRPWQDYRESYSARNSLGGGIILDASHEIDYMLWLFGEPALLSCFAARLSDLEMDVEDTASINIRFASGIFGEVHLDYVQRSAVRTLKIVGTEGTIIWDFRGGFVDYYDSATEDWQRIEITTDANVMYLEEMRVFLKDLRDGTHSVPDIKEGARVLEIALAARESASTGQVIDLGTP